MLNRTQKLFVSLGLVAAFALAVSAPGFAQAAQAPPLEYSTDEFVDSQLTTNQCSSAGEPVSLIGKMHAQLTFVTGTDGVNHFSIVVSNDLNGTGQNSTLPYTAQDSNTYTINTGDAAGDITVEFRSDLNPLSAGSSMTLIQTLHLTANTDGAVGLQVTGSSTQCGS